MAAAYVARKMGVPATIVVPSSSPQLVVQRLRDEGATVKITGRVTNNIKYTVYKYKSLWHQFWSDLWLFKQQICNSFQSLE